MNCNVSKNTEFRSYLYGHCHLQFIKNKFLYIHTVHKTLSYWLKDFDTLVNTLQAESNSHFLVQDKLHAGHLMHLHYSPILGPEPLISQVSAQSIRPQKG